jgi:hypothetical protein
VVEVGQHVVAPTVQGAAELGDFLQRGGTPRRSASMILVIMVLPRRRSGWL